MTHYHVFVPGSAYVWDYYGKNEQDVRQQVRLFLGTTRLPNNTHIEQVNLETLKMLQRNQEEMSSDYAKAGQIFDW